MVMRGGSSKGLYFLSDELPADPADRDRLLLQVMGSPDARQIDGMGGAHPLTSKVAIVSPSGDPDADIDYLFLQLGVDVGFVTDEQNCGNLLAGVGPFALERGLMAPAGDETQVRIRMLNGEGVATATIQTPDGVVSYQGDTAISGVPGTSAPIVLEFADTAGSTCGSLLPTGNAIDSYDGISVTCVDNGMPVVVLDGADVGVAGTESCAELEANDELRARLESIRLAAGPAMGLGDVAELTVPKMTMVTPAHDGGVVGTRTFIPHRCHDAIGVLGAVSVATACLLEGTPAASVARINDPDRPLRLEHPTGHFDVVVRIDVEGIDVGPDQPVVRRAGAVRTARKLMDGTVFPRT